MSHQRYPGYVTGMTPARQRRRIVLQAQNGVCAACGVPLVDSTELRDRGNTILSASNKKIRWRSDDGIVRESLIATVDHIISKQRWAREKRSGSPHSISNLAVLCHRCHARKTSLEQRMYWKRISGVCYKCHGPCSPKRKRCESCRRGYGRPKNRNLERVDRRASSDRCCQQSQT